MSKILLVFLSVLLLITCKSQPQLTEVEVEAEPEIEIIQPEFEIVSIVILQADIVVTELEAILRVKNLNDFALELSSITYELFGNETLWARGVRTDILSILPDSTNETKFKFEMNFIDMRRGLLDDVIAMRQIRYRLRGKALVKPALANIEPFLIEYDESGLSEVRRN